MFSTILAIGAVVVLFIWVSTIVVKAINAAFVPPANLDIDILSIDFEGLKNVAPRLGIDMGVVNNQSNIQPEEKGVLTEPVAKIAENIDVASIKLEILNGTDIKGLAADWAKKFEEAGFGIENIKTGNAEKRDYAGITVYYNATEAVFGKVSAVLNQSNLPVKTEKDGKLDNLYFQIIIGK